MRNLSSGFRALLRALEVLSALIERILTSAGLVFLIAMWGLLLTNTVGRWLFETWGWKFQTGWCLELVGYMIPWTIFFMLGPVAKWNMHIKVTYFPSKLLAGGCCIESSMTRHGSQPQRDFPLLCCTRSAFCRHRSH